MYKNFEWYLQDNWRVSDRLTLDYGVRFYYLTPQWDTTLQASNFLPDSFMKSAAVRLFQPSVVDGVRVGYDAATEQVVNSAFIGRVVPGSGDRFQGTFQGGQGIDETLTDGNKFKVSPRAGFAYDISGRQTLVARGGFGIFYDRPQGNQVFDLITNPPGLQVSHADLGPREGHRRRRPAQRAGRAQSRTSTSGRRPIVYQWNLGMQWKMPAEFVLDVLVRRVRVAGPAAAAADQRAAVRHGLPAVEPGPDPRPDLHGLLGAQHDPRGQRAADRPPAFGLPGLCAASGCGSSRPTRTTRPCRPPSAAGSTRG